jgi:hypothetical protein
MDWPSIAQRSMETFAQNGTTLSTLNIALAALPATQSGARVLAQNHVLLNTHTRALHLRAGAMNRLACMYMGKLAAMRPNTPFSGGCAPLL